MAQDELFNGDEARSDGFLVPFNFPFFCYGLRGSGPRILHNRQIRYEIARDGCGQRGFAAFGKLSDIFVLNFSVHIVVFIEVLI